MGQCRIISYPPVEQLADQQEVQGKFAQFIWQGSEYLLFASREEHRFHNQMLAHFFDDHSIAYQWPDEQTLEFDTAQISVTGGGRFRFVRTQGLLELSDNSQAYGRFNEAGLEAKIRSADHPWSDAGVSIR